MKKLSIEEKAKRFDEIIDKFDVILNLNTVKESGTIFADDVRKIIPELIENEDEEIRKHIIQVFRDHFNGEDCDKCIAWLEKQGEQKPIDKIQLGKKYKCIASPRYSTFRKGEIYKPEDKFLCSLMNLCSNCFEPIEDSGQKQPKFEIGDLITNGKLVGKIDEINERGYHAYFENYYADIPDIENWHKWTIQDAKDGDVLASKDGNPILIFRGIGNTNWDDVIDYHCYYDRYREEFIVQKDVEYWGNIYNHQLKPATKEQRDILMKAMTDAGYTFDFEKKELRKIDQKPVDKGEPKFHKGDWIVHQGTKNIYQVVAIIDNQYQLKYGNNYTAQQCAGVDRCARLWDITKDAKKGDILRHNNCTFIFICIEKGVVKAFEENLYNDTEACNFGEPDKNNDYSPATKEQRDLLLQRMKDVGYEWDAVKKELKKIEQKPTNNQFTPEQADVLDKHIDKFLEQKQDTITQIDPSEYINDMGGNGCYLKNTVESPTWSDEDEKYWSIIIAEFSKCASKSVSKDEWMRCNDWFNSLRNRVQLQSKQEWSEDDERIYKSITYSFAHNYPLTVQQQEFVKSLKNRAQSQNRWKESLATADLENSLCDIQDGFSDTSYEYRILGEAIEFIRCTESKSQWRPSDEQMKALADALSLANNCGEESAFDLRTLHEQLKKLKE